MVVRSGGTHSFLLWVGGEKLALVARSRLRLLLCQHSRELQFALKLNRHWIEQGGLKTAQGKVSKRDQV